MPSDTKPEEVIAHKSNSHSSRKNAPREIQSPKLCIQELNEDDQLQVTDQSVHFPKLSVQNQHSRKLTEPNSRIVTILSKNTRNNWSNPMNNQSVIKEWGYWQSWLKFLPLWSEMTLNYRRIVESYPKLNGVVDSLILGHEIFQVEKLSTWSTSCLLNGKTIQVAVCLLCSKKKTQNFSPFTIIKLIIHSN